MFSQTRRTYYPSLACHHSAVNSVHSSREAESAQGPPSATERRECKSWVTLLLRDADSGQIDHMAAEREPTHIGLTTHAAAQAGYELEVHC